jgi:hypothetical protein
MYFLIYIIDSLSNEYVPMECETYSIRVLLTGEMLYSLRDGDKCLLWKHESFSYA